MNRQELELLQQVRSAAVSGTAKRLRIEAGLSQSELAGVIPVSTSTIALWESGQRVPRGARALTYGRILTDLASRSERDLGVAQ